MANLEFDKEVTGVLIINRYKDLIFEGGKI